MKVHHCSGTRHAWHVHRDGSTLNTQQLSHGHHYQCSRRVIARIECSEGRKHRRVMSKADFDKLMEDR